MVNATPGVVNGVKFKLTYSHFLSLVEHISNAEPRRANAPGQRSRKASEVFERWVHSLEHPLPQRSGVILFRLLFPQEDTRRKYDLQETRLGKLLATVLAVPDRTCLTSWASNGSTTARVGCMGDEVRRVLNKREFNKPGEEISLEAIDGLLDELASHSVFSALETDGRSNRRTRSAILTDLYATLTPFGAACMTQIILKDLRPILYPLPSTRSATNLLNFKSNALDELTVYQAMRIWHPQMIGFYKARSSLDAAAQLVEDLEGGEHEVNAVIPEFGTPVEIPKCLKGESCEKIIRSLRESGQASHVWAETKYDGERMQIHIDLRRPVGDQLRIFSKSKRDSTQDRAATHSIIQAALGLPITTDYHDKLVDYIPSIPSRKFQTNAILEAEMVCYDERTSCIDEFWRIRSLLESTAQGGRARFHSRRQKSHEESTVGVFASDLPHDSLQSDASDGGSRHFMLVFFDVLVLDDRNFILKPYETRRKHLEELVRIIPGFTMLAERVRIAVDDDDAADRLRDLMAQRIADYEEGLVLKPALSTYNDMRSGNRWIKFKKDYIPGLGDTIDMAVVGACWNKERGRELRVGPETFTTFFIGAIDKTSERLRSARSRVHFDILFSVSYGLTREQLEAFNWEIRQGKTYPYDPVKYQCLSYTLELEAGLLDKPNILLAEPRLVELTGAGFSKSPGSKEFHKIACASVGRDPAEKVNGDAMKKIWDLPVSPGIRSSDKRQERMDTWLNKLIEVDAPKQGRKRRLPEKSIGPLSPSPTKRRRSTARENPAPGASTVSSKPCKGNMGPLHGAASPISQYGLRQHCRSENQGTPPVADKPRSRLLSPPQSPLALPVRSPLKLISQNTMVPSTTDAAQTSASSAGPMYDSPRDESTLRRPRLLPQSVSAPEIGQAPPNLKLRRRIRKSHTTDGAIPSLAGLLTLSRSVSGIDSGRGPPATQRTIVMHPPELTPPEGAPDAEVNDHRTKTGCKLAEGVLFYVQPPLDVRAVVEQAVVTPQRLMRQRLGTLEALLWGLGWRGGSTNGPSRGVNKGFVFVDVGDIECVRKVVTGLEEIRDSLKGEYCPLFVFGMDKLPLFYSDQLLGTRDVAPLWSSVSV
ncbi:hypothetical protein FRB99_004925 [Tulasnella sp. 403]|nr:hypothetical protein FRB99_004925 [Tulasnella sp. 403]